MPARKKGKGDPQPISANNESSLPGSNDSSNANSTVIDASKSDNSTRPISIAESSKSGKTLTQDADDGTSIASSRTASWRGGSWKSKAPAMTRLDKDSNVTPNATPERPKVASPDARPPPSPAARRASKSVAVAATTSLISVSSRGASDTRDQEAREPPPKGDEAPLPPDPAPAKANSDAVMPDAPEPAKDAKLSAKSEPSTSTWRGWWSKPDVPAQSSAEKTTDVLTKAGEEAKQTPLPASPELTKKENPLDAQQANGSAEPESDKRTDGATSSNQNRSSWFWAWSKAQNDKADVPAAAEEQVANKEQTKQAEVGQQLQNPEAAPASTANESKQPEKPTAATPSASSWAFWSREKAKADDSSDTASTRKEVGELAVANTPSQSHPEAAQFNEQRDTSKRDPPSVAKMARGRMKGNESSSNASTPVKGTPSGSPTREPGESVRQKTATQSSTQTKKKPSTVVQSQGEGQPTLSTKNVVLPRFDGTYHPSDSPSYWEQIRRFFLRVGPEQPTVHLEPSPARVHNALAIGVHGFFPAAILRQVLGQPTGTSIKFSNFAASAIREWVKAHGDYECEIDKVALEGEGLIADRVETLWKLLLNWIDKIRKADLIIVAAHSQGVPVATMLVAKLIQFGCVNANARIGICAMAGVNMGPFIEYRTSWLGGTANELFEFSRPDSKVSIMYEEALDECLRHGVRICYVGSIDDQLVSLESSTFTPITHPYIYRAVFIHSSLLSSTTALNPLKPQPDFIASLVGFALKLRNLGVPDHGLIRELSPALAGSLVGGEGHSSLYNDLNVYLLAVRCTLETTPLAATNNPSVERWGLTRNAMTTSKPAEKEKGKGEESAAMSANSTTVSSNPFFLPWALRGVLEEELVRKELGDECRDLLALFESWRPVSKGLKDVRFRLEAVKSKL